MSTPSTDSEHAPRKKMRKGTHSCLECRRRKIRCVFTSNASICNECTARGIICIEQERGDLPRPGGVEKRKKPSDRVVELEGMLSKILQRLDAKSSAAAVGEPEMGAAAALQSLRSELLASTFTAADVSTTASTRLEGSQLESDAVCHSSHQFENAPYLSLFDNAVITHSKDEPAEKVAGHSREEDHPPIAEKNARILKSLRALVPNGNDLKLILQSSQMWWSMWKYAFPDFLEAASSGCDIEHTDSLQTYLCQSLDSNKVARIAKIWLCLATSMQLLPDDFEFTRMDLPASPEALQDHYLTSVETLLASDESFAGTIDGLECFILISRIYINLGKPRKAWLVSRRAFNFAHLMGLHRLRGNKSDVMSRRRTAAWLQIWQGDRYLSLILGLPYAAPDSHLDMSPIEQPQVGEGSRGQQAQRFMMRMTIPTGRIIARNQDIQTATFADTMTIDEELEKCKDTMPQDWWDAEPAPHASAREVFETCTAKFLYHNVRKLLHLPFMLKAPADRRYDYSRLATLESAREMLRIYQLMRRLLGP